MNTIIPIIIPTNTEPPKCPNCGKDENIKEVCSHCGHVYEYEETSTTDKVKSFFIIISIVWVFITVVWWLAESIAPSYGHETRSLLEIIQAQIEWITSLKIV